MKRLAMCRSHFPQCSVKFLPKDQPSISLHVTRVFLFVILIFYSCRFLIISIYNKDSFNSLNVFCSRS